MDRQEFLALAATVWDACEEAVTRASSGQVIRETEGVFRERFLELAPPGGGEPAAGRRRASISGVPQGTLFPPQCKCGGVAQDKGNKSKVIATTLADLRIHYHYNYCKACRRGRSPGLQELGIRSRISPLLEEFAILLGADRPFARAGTLLRTLVGGVRCRPRR